MSGKGRRHQQIRYTAPAPDFLNVVLKDVTQNRPPSASAPRHPKRLTRKLDANEVPDRKRRIFHAPLTDSRVDPTTYDNYGLPEQQCVDLFLRKFRQQLKAMPQEQQQEPRVVTANRRQAGSNWDTARSPANNNNNNNNNENENKSQKNAASPVKNKKQNSNSNTSKSEPDDQAAADGQPQAPLSKSARLRQKRKANQTNRYVAMDCEMVGSGTNGMYDVLARVSIVNRNGDVLMDKYVKPTEPVTDYRTHVSGIRPHNIANADDYSAVQAEVIQLLQGKVLVGHGVHNDLTVLQIRHPACNTRDTSRYKQLNRIVSHGRTPSLKHLSRAILGWDIQNGEHDSVEDARATMKIYNIVAKDWEKQISSQRH